jgi:hypothetical protein
MPAELSGQTDVLIGGAQILRGQHRVVAGLRHARPGRDERRQGVFRALIAPKRVVALGQADPNLFDRIASGMWLQCLVSVARRRIAASGEQAVGTSQFQCESR